MNKPILLTGSPRSGSTWSGQMLSMSEEVAYLHEPLNPYNFRRGRCSAEFNYFFTHICEENEDLYKQGLKDLLEFKYQWRAEFPHIRTARDVGRTIRDSSKYAYYRSRQSRPLVKDPIAIFSTEWLAKTFDMDVVVMIRHPAAFAWSIKKKGEIIRFSELLNQPLLMNAYLEPFRDEMEIYYDGAENRVDEAILLWRLIYSVVRQYQQDYSNWTFLKHEDLSQDPVKGFETLYSQLGLAYSTSVQSRIRRYTVPSKRKTVVGGNNINLDSLKNIKSWERHLSKSEIRRIYEGTQDVASFYYGDADWAQSLSGKS